MRILGYQGLMADNPLIPATYPHVFEQKSALGLVKHDLPGLRVDRPPLLFYLLAGYDGSKTSPGKLERLRKAVDHKKKNFNTRRAHTYTFGDFRNEPCTMPSIVSVGCRGRLTVSLKRGSGRRCLESRLPSRSCCRSSHAAPGPSRREQGTVPHDSGEPRQSSQQCRRR